MTRNIINNSEYFKTMNIEYEATFRNINKDEIREKLKVAGAKLIKPEFLQKRSVFLMPSGHVIEDAWLRVRDEQDKITLALKIVKNNLKIEDQKEIELKVDSFETACELLQTIGCKKKGYQENLREKWELDGVEITIDEWPYLEPFVEIEADSEERVKKVAEKLGFNYQNAYFGVVTGLYATKYNLSEDKINNHTPEILFNMKANPFLN